MTGGHIYTVAGNNTPGFSGDGGPGTRAELGFPEAVMPDSAGSLVIADSFNARIRVVAASTGQFCGQHMAAGDIYTVAGGGAGLGDGGPATAAGLQDPGGVAVTTRGTLDRPQAVAVDEAGDMFAADTNNNRIRMIAG